MTGDSMDCSRFDRGANPCDIEYYEGDLIKCNEARGAAAFFLFL